MRRRRFRHSSKANAPASASFAAQGTRSQSGDWQNEFNRLKDIEAVLDARLDDWSNNEPRYQVNHLLPSVSMDRRYDIFMEPRVPEFSAGQSEGDHAPAEPLVLEDPEEILEQIENIVASDEAPDDQIKAQSSGRFRATHKPSPKRGFFRRVFGRGDR